MTELHIPHQPGLHCHHDVVAVECTLCTYLAMEEAHNKAVMELIKEHTDETTATTAEAGETG
jgi:hypothetical protein